MRTERFTSGFGVGERDERMLSGEDALLMQILRLRRYTFASIFSKLRAARLGQS